MHKALDIFGHSTHCDLETGVQDHSRSSKSGTIRSADLKTNIMSIGKQTDRQTDGISITD